MTVHEKVKHLNQTFVEKKKNDPDYWYEFPFLNKTKKSVILYSPFNHQTRSQSEGLMVFPSPPLPFFSPLFLK